MKILTLLITTVVGFLPPLAAFEKLYGNSEVLVVGDTISGSSTDLRPAKDRPIYYVISGKTELRLGDIVAGIKPTDPALVEREVVAALQSQGYVRTGIGGPMPSICLLLIWGTCDFTGYDAIVLNREGFTTEATISPIEYLRHDFAAVDALMGINRWMPPPSDRWLRSMGGSAGARSGGPAVNSVTWEDVVTPAHQKVLARSGDANIYVSVAALDAEALRQKVVRLLWRTNITVDGRNTLAQALPVMLASAAPYFGQRTDFPVFSDEKARRAASIEIGELKEVTDRATRTGPR